jgi:hypothetical protein
MGRVKSANSCARQKAGGKGQMLYHLVAKASLILE